MSGARFIGSKISLVSKSDIRYVGILHDVDPQNATLALEQVVSLGTEGRRGGNPMDEIPPSDTVFKYIVFRGSDVADLQVFEGPPTQQAPYMDNDPNTGHYPPAAMRPPPPPPQQQQQQQQQPPAQFSYPVYGFEPYRPPPMMGFPGYYPQPPPHQHQQQPPLPPPTASPLMHMPEPVHQPNFHPPAFPPPSLVAPTADVPHELPSREQTPPPPAVAPKPDLKDNPVPIKKEDERKKPVSDEIASSVEKLAKSVSELGIAKDRSVIASTVITTTTTTTAASNNTTQEKRSSRSGPRRASTRKHSKGESNVIPLQDFDFASSNAKFNKEQVLRNLLTEEDTKKVEDEVVIPEPDTYYDKSKSFFDDISCDVKERVSLKKSGGEDYRKKHQQEQKLNLETFGELSVETGGRGVRGGRGRGGRGRGRGGARSRAGKPLQGAA